MNKADVTITGNKIHGTMMSGAMSESMSEAPDYRWENEKLLLKAIKEQLKITDEDMRSPSIVRAKIRDAKIDIILE